VLLLLGIVLELWSPVGTALNLVGILLFMVVLVGLGVSMFGGKALSTLGPCIPRCSPPRWKIATSKELRLRGSVN
jgi:hypothetical protein